MPETPQSSPDASQEQGRIEATDKAIDITSLANSPKAGHFVSALNNNDISTRDQLLSDLNRALQNNDAGDRVKFANLLTQQIDRTGCTVTVENGQLVLNVTPGAQVQLQTEARLRKANALGELRQAVESRLGRKQE